MLTSLRGTSKGGQELPFPPVNQPNKPPEDEDLAAVATALELENLASLLLLAPPYSHITKCQPMRYKLATK